MPEVVQEINVDLQPYEEQVERAEELREDRVELFPEAQRMPLYWENLFAEEKVVIDQGGMYSGKTEAIMRVLFTLAIVYPNLIIHVVANSIPKLKEDSMQVADRIYKNNRLVRHYLKGDINKSEREYSFRNGSTITFKSYETAEQAEGAKRDVLYINEGRRIAWPVAYLLIKRTNWKVFVDYNPVARFWIHDEIINCPEKRGKKEFPSVKVIRSWHIHNEFISQEKHDEVENIADPELWKAYARGLTAQLSGLVYPSWTKVPMDFIDGAQDVIWAMDVGFTNDPTVYMKIAKNYKGYDYVFKAFGYVPGIPAVDINSGVREHDYKSGQVLYMDHNKTLKRELRQLGIRAVHALKPKGSVESGVLYLRTKKIAICQEPEPQDEHGLEYELERNMFETLKDGTRSNKPEHQFSHGPSAMRYGAYTDAVRNGLTKDNDPDGEQTEDDNETE